LSNDEKRLMLTVRYHKLPTTIELTDLEMHRFWRKLGLAGGCMPAGAGGLSGNNRQNWVRVWIALIERVQRLLEAIMRVMIQWLRLPLLDGNQLMVALSLQRGKTIGQLLDVIREGQVTGDILTAECARRRPRFPGPGDSK
jgi:hypothetical protein